MGRSSPDDPVSRLGEDRLVERLTRGLPQTPRTLTGPGDDCAVLRGPDKNRLTLFKTDALVEGVHFTPDTDAARVGWKALCRVISDIAAMGGEPREALITVALPRTETVGRMDRLYQGIRRAARRFGCGIAGGETTSVPSGGGLMISVAMLGTVERRLLTLRSGAAAGDLIMVTGRLGGSLAGHHLDFVPRLAEARWLADRFRPRAMMDLSDGLAADLPRLAAASRVGYRLDPAALPRNRGCSVEQALNDGEDYELLFTLAPARLPALRKAWPGVFPRVPLTVIGEVLADPRRRPVLSGGWEHFRS